MHLDPMQTPFISYKQKPIVVPHAPGSAHVRSPTSCIALTPSVRVFERQASLFLEDFYSPMK